MIGAIFALSYPHPHSGPPPSGLSNLNIMINDGIAFLFDLDGVVVDSEREYTRIWDLIDSVHPSGAQNFSRRIKGSTLDKILHDYYPEPDVRSDVERILYGQEAAMVYRYCPGAREFVNALRERGLPRALVTSSNRYKMKRLSQDLPELEGLFEVVICAEMISHSKPDPEGYLKGASMLGVAPERCAVFEDSLQGVLAGHAAGAYVVGVAGTLPADVISPNSDEVVNSLADVNIPELIETLRLR